MSFAAGMQAGSAAASRAIDAFRQARTNRNERRFNEEMAALEEERQARMQVPEPVGSGVLTPEAQQGINTQLKPLAGTPGTGVLRPEAQNIGTVGLSQMPAVPANPMTTSEYFQRQAALASKHNLTDRAEQYMAQGLQAQQIENQQAQFEKQFGLQQRAEDRADIAEARAERADTRAGELHEQNLALVQMNVEAEGYKLDDYRAIQGFYEFSRGKSISDALNSEEYRKLNPEQRQAISGTLAGISKAELDTAQSELRKETNKLKTFDEMLTFANADNRVTEGSKFITGEDERTGRFWMQLVDDEGNKLQAKQDFADQNAAKVWLREMMIDPSTAAIWYDSHRKDLDAAAATAAQARVDSMDDALTYVQKMNEMLQDNIHFQGLSPEEKAQRYNQMLTPIRNYFGEEQYRVMIGALPQWGETDSGSAFWEGLSELFKGREEGLVSGGPVGTAEGAEIIDPYGILSGRRRAQTNPRNVQSRGGLG